MDLISRDSIFSYEFRYLACRYIIMKQDLLIVGIGGFVGTMARYLVYVWMGSRNLNSFPWGTLLVNLIGCLAIGFISMAVEKMVPHHRQIYLAVSVGFLGAFTTFSAFGLETLNLMRQQQIGFAFLNIALNVIFGITMVWIGRTLGTVL